MPERNEESSTSIFDRFWSEITGKPVWTLCWVPGNRRRRGCSELDGEKEAKLIALEKSPNFMSVSKAR